MSLASLEALESQLHGMLRAVPLMTTAATYTPPTGSPVSLRLLLDDEALLRIGAGQTTSTQQRVVRIARADLTPVVRGTLTIDGVVWRIVDLLSADEGQTTWVCERAR